MEAALLASKLSQLGRDLDTETRQLSDFEFTATVRGGTYQRLKEEYEDDLARAFLAAEGTVDIRKNRARLACINSRLKAQDALEEWNKAKSVLRMQAESISTLKVRIDIGRSLLSHEKSLLALEQSGIS